MYRRDVTNTVDSPPRFRAPWPEAAFEIGSYGPRAYSALSAMAKTSVRREYLWFTLAPSDLRFLQRTGVVRIMEITGRWQTPHRLKLAKGRGPYHLK